MNKSKLSKRVIIRRFKNLIIAFLFIGFPISSSAQYHWVSKGAKWYYHYRESAFNANIGYMTLEYITDTLITDKLCTVLEKKIVFSDNTVTKLENEIVFFDSIQNKIFRYTFNEFYLLYNFNAEKDDTIIILNPNSNISVDTILLKIDSLKYVSISDKELKTFYTRKIGTSRLDFQGEVIEGIGNERFFFPLNQLDCDNGCPDPFRCFVDKEMQYSDGIFECDYIYNSVQYNENHAFKIFPNPTDGIIYINGTNYDFELEIFDLLGNKYFQKVFQISDHTPHINISLFNKGIYILKFKCNNNTEAHIISKF